MLNLQLPAFTIANFLSAQECAEMIAIADKTNYCAERIAVDYRRSNRVLIDSPQASSILFERLAPLLAKVPGLGNGPKGGWKRCIGLNEMLRFLKYWPGDFFRWHQDERFVREDDGPYGKAKGDTSLLTMMIYLSTPTKGGETNFRIGGSVPHAKGMHQSRAAAETVLSVRPVTGMCLVFDHSLEHAGATVLEGTKAAIRTDVMYTRREE